MKNNKIFLYDRERALLIFLLISNLMEDNVIYVTYDIKEKDLKRLEGKKIIIKSNDIIKDKIFNRLKAAIYIKKFRFKERKLLEKIKNGEIKLYGIDFLALERRVFYKEDLYMIEEGTINYTFSKRKKSFKYYLKLIFNKIFLLKEREELYGYGEKIKKIYFTENLCKEIPKGLENKVEVVNLKKLWDKKTKEEKRIILDVFNFNSEILKKIDKNTIILFTQPLSEDGILTEEEKIELYLKILKKYENQSVIIKLHPREKTDYSEYFSNCYIMEEKYPIEILELIGINIKKAITIFSSAVFGLGKNVDVDFYGTEIHPKLLKKFGSQNKVMERNVFLD